MKLRFIFLCMFIMAVAACKKEEEKAEPTVKTELQLTAERVQHNWNFDKFIHHETVGALNFADTVVGVAGDYFDFRTNNFVYARWDNVEDTVAYSVLDKAHILYGGDTFIIQILLQNQFIFSNDKSSDTTSVFNEIRLSK